MRVGMTGKKVLEMLGRRQILLSASLLLLVAGFGQGTASAAGRYLILAHFGLFLLWQPLLRTSYRLGALDLGLLLALLAGFLFAMSPGLLAVWVTVLAAVIGGRSFVASSIAGRLPYLISVILLILFLVLVLMPEAMVLQADDVTLFSTLTQLGLPLLALAVAFFPVDSDCDPQTLGGIDLLSALVLLLVLAVTLLGALALMQVRGLHYFHSLALSLIGMAGAVLLLAWAWQPRLGYAGLGVLLSRRMFSSGLSFESWLQALAGSALAEPDPNDFLRGVLDDLRRYPGIVGGWWHYAPSGDSGRFGIEARVREPFRHAGLEVELHFARRPSEGLLWHYNLMLLVLAEFYREKCQTRLLQLRSFEEAVHETGARLTHDVKNLLQSLNALCFAASRPDGDEAALQRLFRRQLPQIAARLERTLEKLRQPEEVGLAPVELGEWWREACARHEGQRIRFTASLGGSTIEVPAELYDTCLDNLLQNAIGKRQLEPAIEIDVEADGRGRLRVCDSGSPIPAAVSGSLMHLPLRSEQGLGMGLYQAAQLARRAGFRLELASNETGRVCFELYRVPDSIGAESALRSAVD